MEVQFVIPGEVKGKGRPRATIKGGYAMLYTPKDTVNYENLVKFIYTQKYDHKFYQSKPLYANIYAYFNIPKSTSKKNLIDMQNKVLRPLKAPDTDNIAKIILDALNKIAYDDDKQIVRLCVGKYYSETPRVEVEIGEL